MNNDDRGDDHPEWKKSPEERASLLEMAVFWISVLLILLGVIIALAGVFLGGEGIRIGFGMVLIGGAAFIALGILNITRRS